MTTTPEGARIIPLVPPRRRVPAIVAGAVFGVAGLGLALIGIAILVTDPARYGLAPGISTAAVGLAVAFEGVWLIARFSRRRAVLAGTVLTVVRAFGSRSADLAAVETADVTPFASRIGTRWSLRLSGGGDLRRLAIFSDSNMGPGQLHYSDLAAIAEALERNPNRTAVTRALEGLDFGIEMAGGKAHHHPEPRRSGPVGVFGQAPARRRRVPAETPDTADGPAGT